MSGTDTPPASPSTPVGTGTVTDAPVAPAAGGPADPPARTTPASPAAAVTAAGADPEPVGTPTASTNRAPDPVTPEPREQLPGLSTQLAAEISGPIAVRLSGLPQVEHEEFRARASVAAAGSSSSHPAGPAGQRPSPIAPGGSGPTAVDAGGTSSGGAGSSG